MRYLLLIVANLAALGIGLGLGWLRTRVARGSPLWGGIPGRPDPRAQGKARARDFLSWILGA